MTFYQAATLCRWLTEREREREREREKEILKEDVLFGSGAIIPLNRHKAPAPCRRSKNKPLRLALPASNNSLPIARANAATWCAAPTPRARASLATICEIAPNIRHGKRYHPLSRVRRSSGNLAIFAAMRHGPILFYRVQIEHGKIGRHVRLARSLEGIAPRCRQTRSTSPLDGK